jgi:hypothetical protein
MKQLLELSFLTAAMVISAASFAQEQPRKMLGGSFDLKAAVLDPAPLGPPSQFVPPPAAASAASPAVTAEPAKPTVAASETSAPRRTVSSKPRQKSAVAARKPPRPNPLNSYATDTRRQTWPCSGGGICAWSQQR